MHLIDYLPWNFYLLELFSPPHTNRDGTVAVYFLHILKYNYYIRYFRYGNGEDSAGNPHVTYANKRSSVCLYKHKHQTIALFSAIFRKLGTSEDRSAMRTRWKHLSRNDPKEGRDSPSRSNSNSSCSGGDSRQRPCLIVCPKTLVNTWWTEFETWGYFRVDVLQGGSGSSSRERAEDILQRARRGRALIVDDGVGDSDGYARRDDRGSADSIFADLQLRGQTGSSIYSR